MEGSLSWHSIPNEPVMESYGYNKIIKEKFRYVWSIHTFSLRPVEVGKCIISDQFRIGNNSLWRLELYPIGKSDETKDYLSLYLEFLAGSDVQATFKFSIIDAEKKEIHVKKSTDVYQFSAFVSLGFDKYLHGNVLTDYPEKYLPGDQLTISCEIIAITDSVKSSVNDAVKSSVNSSGHTTCTKESGLLLLRDLGILFESSKFSDVILSASGKEFHVHKSILAVRSPVFQAMFEHEMQEKQCNRVDITDVDQEVLQELLRFIYTGKVSKLDKVALSLLVAADKYGLKVLKTLCAETLYDNNLTTETASEILMTADVHNIHQLKTKAIDFINKNASEVMETDGWKSMVQSHPHLLLEMYAALAADKSH